jgi:methylphosphotriester-DNA--protein-cysteine methyltransferase
MKRSQFTDGQIAFILRQAEEETAVEEVCRKAGISIQTYYRWRKKHGGLMPSELSLPDRLVRSWLRWAEGRPSPASSALAPAPRRAQVAATHRVGPSAALIFGGATGRR